MTKILWHYWRQCNELTSLLPNVSDSQTIQGCNVTRTRHPRNHGAILCQMRYCKVKFRDADFNPVKGMENFKKELSTTFENEALIIPNHFLLQGQENDIILVSLVRSNNENKIGFLSQKNRICVAISRARCGLYLFGNQAQLEYKSSVWKVCWVILNLATDSWVACDLLSLLWTSD